MLKRYLETSCDTLVDAAAAFDRLKQAKKLVSRLKTTFENTVLSINPEDICSLNPSTLFNPFKSMVESKSGIGNRPQTDLSDTIFDNPNEINGESEMNESIMNPFEPRALKDTCTHPSGFWNKLSLSVSTELEERFKTTQNNVSKSAITE